METLGGRIGIMVSSTRADLDPYRMAAAEVIESLRRDFERDLQLIDLSMEHQLPTGMPEGPAAASRRWVEEADWLVLILGWHYGSISSESGTQGLGFTEIEYRRARELGKRVFMFLADDASDPALAQWRNTDALRRQLLERFRAELAERFFLATFADLGDFRTRLARTLHAALQGERDRLVRERFGLLGDLIEAVGPDIRDFADKMALINAYKRVHDCLHSHLQHGIRPLREHVLGGWRERSPLSDEMYATVLDTLGTLRECNGALRAEWQRLVELLPGRGGPLQARVEAVLRTRELLLAQVHRPSDKGLLAEQVEDYALEIRCAFRDVDDRIHQELGLLDTLYTRLLQAILAAQQRRSLGQAEQATLSRQLDEIDTTRTRLAHALEVHHAWQQAHDAIEQHLALPDDVTQDWPARLASLIDLVHDEAQLARQDAPGYLAFARSHGLQSPPDLAALEQALSVQRAGPADGDALLQVFKPFYDAFWVIDKRARHELESAKTRVDTFVERLQALERARRHATPTAGEPT